MGKTKVAIALSGGLDSAVSAALLLEKGYEVIGVTMRLADHSSQAAAPKARVIAKHLGIPLHVLDFSFIFEKEVVAPFCEQYVSGATPNPCVLCNRKIKFGVLLDEIRKMGVDFLASGHYARITKDSSCFTLCKAFDPIKDQTYFLYTLKADILPRLLFPIGNMFKKDVVELAKKLRLPVSTNEESHDICFMSGVNYRNFIRSRIVKSPGKVYDFTGRHIGFHRGISDYTIGQRQGLNFGQQEKYYVTAINKTDNTITIGPKSQLEKSRLIATGINWISGFPPRSCQNLTAKIRYGAPEIPVMLSKAEDNLEVIFATPVYAVTPGQSVVFYSGDELLGGGIIHS